MARKTAAFLLLILALGVPLHAQEAPTKAALIEEFIVATNLEQTQKQMFEQIRNSTVQQTEQLFSPQIQSNPAARGDVKGFQDQVMAFVTDKLSWEKTKPLYVALYDEVFTQEELQSLVEFFRSPAGKSYINKMPALMEKSNQRTQAQFNALGPELQRMVGDFAAKMQVKYPGVR